MSDMITMPHNNIPSLRPQPPVTPVENLLPYVYFNNFTGSRQDINAMPFQNKTNDAEITGKDLHDRAHHFSLKRDNSTVPQWGLGINATNLAYAKLEHSASGKQKKSLPLIRHVRNRRADHRNVLSPPLATTASSALQSGSKSALIDLELSRACNESNNHNATRGPSNNDIYVTIKPDIKDMRYENVLQAGVSLYHKHGQREALASLLQRAEAIYVPQQDGNIAKGDLKLIIQRWVENNVFPEGLPEYIASAVSTAISDNPTSDIRLQQLRSLLNPNRIDRLNNCTATVKHFIRDDVIHKWLPILGYPANETEIEINKIKLDNLDWVLINAGLHFYDSIQERYRHVTNHLSPNEALVLGKLLYENLKTATLPPQLAAYFTFANQIRDRVTQTIKPNAQPDTINRCSLHSLVGLFNDIDDQRKEQNPFYRYQHQLSEFKTRPQLAESLIKQHCLKNNISITDYLNYPGKSFCRDNADSPALQKLESAVFGLTKSMHMAHVVQATYNHEQQLPDVNAAFIKQNQAIVDTFKQLNSLVLMTTLASLPEEDFSFLQNATVQAQTMSLELPTTFIKDSLLVPQAKTFAGQYLPSDGNLPYAFFSATHGTEKRIYLLNKDNGYRLVRVDEDWDLWRQYVPEIPTHNVFMILPNLFKDVIHQPGEKFDNMINHMVEHHGKILLTELHNQGYEPTGLEQAEDFLKSLIPFYTCVHDLKEEKYSEAIAACTLDIIMVAFPVAEFAALNERVAIAFSRGMATAFERTAQEALIGKAVPSILKAGGENMVRYALHPAVEVVGKKELIPLATSVVRAADPGVELLYHASRHSLRTMLPTLKSLPFMERVVSHLEKDLAKITAELPSGTERTVGRFPNSDTEIAVLTTGEHQADGGQLCVMPDSENTGALRRLWALSENGELTRVKPDIVAQQDLQKLLAENVASSHSRHTAKMPVAQGKEYHQPVSADEGEARVIEENIHFESKTLCRYRRDTDGVGPAGDPNCIPPDTLNSIQTYLQHNPNEVNLDMLVRQFQVDRGELERLGRQGLLSNNIRDSLEAGPARLNRPMLSTSQQYQMLPRVLEATQGLTSFVGLRSLAQGWGIRRLNTVFEIDLDVIPETANFLTMSNYQQLAEDYLQLEQRGFVPNDFRMNNLIHKPSSHSSSIRLDTTQGYAPLPLAESLRAKYPDTRFPARTLSHNRSLAEGDANFLMSLMNIHDAAYYAIYQNIRATRNGLRGLSEAESVQHRLFVRDFVIARVHPQYQESVRRFLEDPVPQNMIPVPVHDAINWQSPQTIVSALSLQNPTAIRTLGRQALAAATTPEQEAAILIARHAGGDSTLENLMISNNKNARLAWHDVLALASPQAINEVNRFISVLNRNRYLHIHDWMYNLG